LASLPVEASDFGASDLVSDFDLFSEAGADEVLLPFPLDGGVLDFFA
jgi:hypothetical protein